MGARSLARSQHFLRSSALAAEIVRASGIGAGDLVLDLGAGTGALTRPLVQTGARVVAVELDPQLARSLRSRFHDVVEADVRRIALPREPFRVVANPPFQHATEVLRRLLDPRVPLEGADVVVQWELAAKRAAVWPSTRLGVVWGAWHELSLVRRLPRCCFAPPPAVDCALLRSRRRARPLIPTGDFARYDRFVERGFRAGLRAIVPRRTLKRLADELGFDRDAKPRDLDARQWAALFRHSLVRPGR